MDLVLRLLVVAGCGVFAIWICSVGLRRRAAQQQAPTAPSSDLPQARTAPATAGEEARGPGPIFDEPGLETLSCPHCGDVSSGDGTCPDCGATLTPRRAA